MAPQVQSPAPETAALSPQDARRIDEEIQRIVAQLVGTTPRELDPGLSFIELGYDSFLLIQLADALSAAFATDIDVRRLYSDLDSAGGVGEYVKGQVRLGSTPPTAPAPTAPPRGPEPVAAAASQAPSVPTFTAAVRPSTPNQRAATAAAATPVTPEQLQAETEWARRTSLSKRVTEEDRHALADQRNLMTIRKGRREESYPVVGVRGEGAYFTDVDGNRYLDLCMGFGVVLLAHSSARR